MSWVYRPDHPLSNENGMIERSQLYEYEPGAAPYVITDEMEPLRHMADNRMFTSKAKFRANTKAHGCYEIGNETETLLKPRKRVELDRRQRRDDIKRAIWEVRNGIQRKD
jgi:hypothetical protein